MSLPPDFEDTQPTGPAHEAMSDTFFLIACALVFIAFLAVVIWGPQG
jgi:hypothetical protein